MSRKVLIYMTLFGVGTSAFAADFPPGVIHLVAGGPISASASLGADCDAWITEEASHSFTVDVPGDLLFRVESPDDTVLIVADADGGTYCDDDSGEGWSPSLTVPVKGAQGAALDVWVGTYEPSKSSASLFVIGLPDTLESSRVLDVVFGEGFARETIEVEAGGYRSPRRLHGADCTGFVGEEPSFTFRYEAGQPSLRIGVESHVDSTLVVRLPSGRWLCNDDSNHGDRNAAVEVQDPDEGVYAAWAGVYDLEDVVSSVRLVLETGPAQEPDTSLAEPEFLGYGTGFAVSDQGHVVTNEHVVAGCDRLTFRRLGHPEEEAALVQADESVDLALLKDGSRGRPFAPISGRLTDLGQAIGTLGFPGTEEVPSFSTGVVASNRGFEGWIEFTHSAETRSGSSGSAIVDSRGHVVGVVTGRLSSTDSSSTPVNVGYATRAFVLRLFLEGNGVTYSLASGADLPRPWTEIADQAGAYTGVVSCYLR